MPTPDLRLVNLNLCCPACAADQLNKTAIKDIYDLLAEHQSKPAAAEFLVRVIEGVLAGVAYSNGKDVAHRVVDAMREFVNTLPTDPASPSKKTIH